MDLKLMKKETFTTTTGQETQTTSTDPCASLELLWYSRFKHLYEATNNIMELLLRDHKDELDSFLYQKWFRSDPHNIGNWAREIIRSAESK